MPNLIDVRVPTPDMGEAPAACAHERYGRMWCPHVRTGQPVEYHHLPMAAESA
jgi:hypothetical protein